MRWEDQQVFSRDRQLEATDGHGREEVVVLGQRTAKNRNNENWNYLRRTRDNRRRTKLTELGRLATELLRSHPNSWLGTKTGKPKEVHVSVSVERSAGFPRNKKGVGGWGGGL